MKKTSTLILTLISIINISNAQNFLQKGLDIDGEADPDFSGWSVSMPESNTVAIGAYENDGNGINSGHVRIYRWNSANGGIWEQKGSDIDGEAAYNESGKSVSMPDSNTVAIGAPSNNGSGSNAGHVRIYRWIGSAWVQKGIDIDGESNDDNSGFSVCMPDSNTVAIGAPYNDGNGINSGHVRIFRWNPSNGGTWVQKGGDIDGGAPFAGSGYSVSMPDSNTIAIGAPTNGGVGILKGLVRMFSWNGIAWVQKGNDIDGEANNDQFGYSVSMPDINTVAIGAPYNDGIGSGSTYDYGHVRIYNWNPSNGGTWVQKGLDIDGEASIDKSGWSVSMPDSNTVAIGAPENDGNGSRAGHVRIYYWDGNAWIQKGIDIDGEAPVDYSGYSVSMPDTNTVAIGAPRNNSVVNNVGHVRVYSALNVVGFLENNLDKALTVYPNPTNSELNIDLGANYKEVTLILRNQLGQDILKKNYGGSNILQLNIPGDAGVYFVEIISGDKKAILKVMKE